MKFIVPVLLVKFLILSVASANQLPTEAEVIKMVQRESELLSCVQLASVLANETVPSTKELLNNSQLKSAAERKLSGVVLQEMANQLVLKCQKEKEKNNED